MAVFCQSFLPHFVGGHKFEIVLVLLSWYAPWFVPAVWATLKITLENDVQVWENCGRNNRVALSLRSTNNFKTGTAGPRDPIPFLKNNSSPFHRKIKEPTRDPGVRPWLPMHPDREEAPCCHRHQHQRK